MRTAFTEIVKKMEKETWDIIKMNFDKYRYIST